MDGINNILDVKALLRRFGIVIYMGDRLTDYEMWEEELRELYQESMIDVEEFRAAMMILQKAKRNDVDV
ncbi:YqgQ family protein [Aneurinibacillus aneurinilyticus]|uniref:YqgQ family protein n=1 Tax=Aneurinibacillus aneurinilyticus TaxID=1391 RepID=UPI002E1D684A